MSHRARKCPREERGVSEVVGVILILGMLVVTFSAFYPIWRQNEIHRLEAEHMYAVRDSFLELKSKIEGLSPGDLASVNLKLGRGTIAFGPDSQVSPNLSGTPALLKTVKIYPDQDGYISENLPDTTFGADPSLQVACTKDNTRRTFLKFPLENIPIHAMVLKADLWLYCEEAARPVRDVTDVRCYSVDNDEWSEESLNWGTQPPMVKALDSHYVDGSGWISMTVKDFVASEIGGDQTASIGLRMKQENYDSAERYVTFSSVESGDRGPYLEIMYAEGMETPLNISYAYPAYEDNTEGGTTGISGAQNDDGIYENIYEINYGEPISGTILASPSSTSGGWTNPTNAYADGGGYASVTSGTPSAFQVYSGYVFNIPSERTITSVKVRYDAWSGISFIGYTSSTGNNPTSGTFTLPTGWQPGDVAIFWWYTYANNKTFTAPAGVTQKQQAASAGYGRIYIGYRPLQSGDTTFSWTSSSVRNSTTIWGVSVFRGVNVTGDPFEAQWGAPATFRNRRNPDPPAVTTVNNNACVVAIFGKNNSYTSIAPPTNYTTAGSNSSPAGNNASAGVAYRVIGSPGTEDPGAWTLGGGSGRDDGYVWTGALKPDRPEQIRVDVSWDGGNNWSSPYITNLSGIETTYLYDVTSATSWTIQKLSTANFRVRVDAYTVEAAGEVRLDWIPVEVTYGTPKYRENVEHHIKEIPIADEYQLQIKYYINGDSENVMLYLYDYSDGSWDHIENLSNHDASNPEIFTYILTGTNYISTGGEVRVRYVQPDNDLTQTSLMVDYCRVEAKVLSCKYVTGEYIAEGGTTGVNGAQNDDGSYENIYESLYQVSSIALDATSSTSGNASSFLWPHTTSGSNRILFVGVSIRNSGSQTVRSINYGGNALTFLRADTNGTNVRTELWYLVNPPLGSNTVSVTLSGQAKAVCGAISYTGVDQTNPIDNHFGATGSSATASASVTVNTENSWVMAVLAQQGTGTNTTSDTTRYDSATSGQAPATNVRGTGADKDSPQTTGSETVSFTLNPSTQWAESIVAFKPATAYRMDVRHDITDIPPADRYNLQIKYYTAGDLEPVSLLLYNWNSGEWNNIGNLQVGGSESAPHIFPYTFNTDYISDDGEVRVRYVQPDNDKTQTSLMVDYCRVETIAVGVVGLSPFGGVEFAARNDFYPSQTYVYEAGAVILLQGDANIMISEPLLLSISEVGANLRVEVNYWVIENRGSSIASTGTATIRATCKSTSGYVVTPVDANVPNRDNVTILIPTTYYNAWSRYLEDLCAGPLKNYDAEWRRDLKSGGLKLIIYGSTRDPGVNDIIYYEKLNELEITIS